jgi:plastocyanin domain-containing protein
MNRRQAVLAASASALFLAAGAWGCAPKAAGPRTIAIAVTEQGFVPAEITLRAGEPVTLLVTRKTDATCAKEIVIGDGKIRHDLPLNQEVRIPFTPDRTGDVRYACGMDMIAGTMKVE